jgi:signal transduction histidine kinase
MKLWKKISLVCSIILIIIVTICSSLLLLQAKNNILEPTYENIQEKQRNLATSFSQMANYYIQSEHSDAVKNALAEYCFSRFADSSAVLLKNGKTLYSQVSVLPEDFLTINDSMSKMYSGKIQGKNILIAGSSALVHGEEYQVYIVEDISAIDNMITGMVLQFIGISVASIVFGTMLIVLLVRRAIKPLKKLRETTKDIAQGDYQKRVEIHAKDEVSELACDFNKMADAVEIHVTELIEKTERQRLFIDGVTHEFKTPLTTMMLHANMLRRANMNDIERYNSLEHIEKQCGWLERLTQKLLRLTLLEQNIELKNESVQILFERVRQSVQRNFEERNTSLVLYCATDTLSMDIDLMQSLLINLVDNASKSYEDDAHNPSVRNVFLSAYDNVLEVKDYGRGIPELEIKRIFEPFYMIDSSRNKKNGSSGLGLALVERIANAHNAKLSLESEPGKGTTVKVVLGLQKDYN